METGTDLTVDVANVIAAEMKNWALEKGASPFRSLVSAADRDDRGKT